MQEVDIARLTPQELADVTGASVDDLGRWERLGLIGDSSDGHPAGDVERVRLITFARQRGIEADEIAQATRTQGDVLGHYVAMTTGGRTRIGRALPDVASASGLDLTTLDRLWAASGLGDQTEAYEEDIAALGWLRTALDAGLPEDALTQIVRVFADTMGRAADAEARLFHYYVHERHRAEGLSGTALTDATEAVSEPLARLIEPALLYFHRKAYQRALREDLLLHVAEETTPPSDVVGAIRATILFVDLSGFTPLTEAMGDAAAAAVTARFSDLVRQATTRCHGRVVKQIGDEFMLAFTEPAAALACGLDIDTAAMTETQFPALRLGAHTGTVLYREGDYVGATVNIAARVTGQADRHQFLITEALRSDAEAMPDVEVQTVGSRDLRGVPGPVELSEIRRPAHRPSRAIDPVCLMELDPTSVVARLTRHSREVGFCSDECLKLFVAAPDRYNAPTPGRSYRV